MTSKGSLVAFSECHNYKSYAHEIIKKEWKTYSLKQQLLYDDKVSRKDREEFSPQTATTRKVTARRKVLCLLSNNMQRYAVCSLEK